MITYTLIAGLLLSSVSAAGIVQAGLGLGAVSRFAGPRSIGRSDRAARPAVTILKPLHGDEPLLEEALESFFTQDYPNFQLIFGVHSPTDPAIAVVRTLRHRYPGSDVALVIDGARHGANHKISNVINMQAAAKHDVLVLADSDVHVAPDYLERLVAALAIPGTGAVTTLYAGRPAHRGITGALGASYISHVFLPGALLARLLGRQDCLGATMAFRRETLDAIGGFAALVDHLADDAVLGTLVQHHGLSVRLATTVPSTTVPETTLGALLQHELRWAHTIRSLAPVGHAFSAIQFPIAWALLAVLASGFATWTGFVVLAAWLARAVAAQQVDRLLHLPSAAPVWLMPLRDLICVALIVASYRGGKVRWRGQVVEVDRPLYVVSNPARTPYRAAEPALGEG